MDPAIQQLRELIEQGIIFEDDFVSTYTEVLNSPEFLTFFDENQEKAKALINTLIKESRLHKNILVNILNKT